MKVYDHTGQERDLAYLRAKYGPFEIQPANPPADQPFYRITALRERIEAPATIIVKVLDPDGNPLEGVPVAWYWPDAPHDPNAGPASGVPDRMYADRCVMAHTNANGDVGLPMGGGAYYWPAQGQIGPHAAWAYGPNTHSDVLLGLGMVAQTNHDHFDLELTRLPPGSSPPTPTERHWLDVTPTPGGTVWFDPPQPDDGYEHGTLVTLEARPAPSCTFRLWSGDIGDIEQAVTNPIIQLSMVRGRTVAATFECEEPPAPPNNEEAKRLLTEAQAKLDEADALIDEAKGLL